MFIVMPSAWSTTSGAGGLFTWPDIQPGGQVALAVNPSYQSQVEAWCTQYGFSYTLA
jgi:hypothetical protein